MSKIRDAGACKLTSGPIENAIFYPMIAVLIEFYAKWHSGSFLVKIHEMG